MICRLCKTRADEEHPDTVYGLNPETFRQAIMHWWCFVSAYESLEGAEANEPTAFEDRQDEYDQQAQAYPVILSSPGEPDEFYRVLTTGRV